MYITETDLLQYLDEQDLSATGQSSNIIPAINYACNLVKDRIGHVYDITAEFALTGANRSSTLVDLIADIAVWKLCKPFPMVQTDGKKHTLFQDALKRLDDIEKGKLTAGLIRLTDDNGGSKTIAWGTQENFDIKY